MLSSVNVGVRIVGPIQGSRCKEEMKSFLSRAQPEPVASALQEGCVLVRAGLQNACPYPAMHGSTEDFNSQQLIAWSAWGKQPGKGNEPSKVGITKLFLRPLALRRLYLLHPAAG